MQYRVSVNGKAFDVTVDLVGGSASAPVVQPTYAAPPAPVAARVAAPTPVAAVAAGEERVLCPISGNVWKIPVTVGQQVAAGECLVILEAMKMEQDIPAPRAGVVKQILVSPGAAVQTDDVLIVLT
ncbi:MAG: acetyl-CoA carboxylase biotin carboxyl carrier protein subunit [Oscillospiraceae bacterium]|nr:acetyl-CoA carboxylase biotin carboxyl carrier protein subunit [Oscillospiraceae bacterium]